MIGGATLKDPEHIYTVDATGKRCPGFHEIGDRFRLTEMTYAMAQEYLTRGTAVHEGIRLLDKGTLDWNTVDEEVKGYLSGYSLFRLETGFKPTQSELIVYHPKLNYACRLDLLDEENGIIVEIKTGTMPKWTRYQTVAQEMALEFEKPLERWGVELHPDGTYRPEKFTAGIDHQIWLCYVSLWNQQANEGYKMYP